MFGVILVLFLASSVSSQEIKEVYCNHIIGSTICLFNYLVLDEVNYRFKPVNLGSSPQLTVIISNAYNGYSNVPILSSDICDTFTDLRQFEIAEVNLQTIMVDAFTNCRDLDTIDIHGNPITQFPPTLLVNQQELTYLYLHRLKIQKLDDGFFANQKKLELLEMPYGGLTEFSPNIVRPLTALRGLDLRLQPIPNLDVDGIRNACPSLLYFYY